jgi:hypothetical protein
VCASNDNSVTILGQNRPLHFLWQNRQQLSIYDGRLGGGGQHERGGATGGEGPGEGGLTRAGKDRWVHYAPGSH